jgi:hypothetical protein
MCFALVRFCMHAFVLLLTLLARSGIFNVSVTCRPSIANGGLVNLIRQP